MLRNANRDTSRLHTHPTASRRTLAKDWGQSIFQWGGDLGLRPFNCSLSIPFLLFRIYFATVHYSPQSFSTTVGSAQVPFALGSLPLNSKHIASQRICRGDIDAPLISPLSVSITISGPQNATPGLLAIRDNARSLRFHLAPHRECVSDRATHARTIANHRQEDKDN